MVMSQQNRLHLLAEQKFLQEQLAELPATAKLTRMSDEARLADIELQLAQLPVEEVELARVRLTFKGEPVVKSHGIFAEFGLSFSIVTTIPFVILAFAIRNESASGVPALMLFSFIDSLNLV